MKITYDEWLAEVQDSVYNLQDVPVAMLTAELCAVAVQNNGGALQYVPKNTAYC